MKRTPMRPSVIPLRRRRRLNPMSTKRRKEWEDSRPVVAAVIQRDGGCVLRGTPFLGACFGPLSAHHLRKASAGGAWTMDNLVTACSAHQVAVENNPDVAWGLGLVVRNGGSTAYAWNAMRNAGLSLGPQQVRCTGSWAEVPSRRVVHNGCFGCPTCGHCIPVTAHPEWAGDFVSPHDLDGEAMP